jgi:hypothetical protein
LNNGHIHDKAFESKDMDSKIKPHRIEVVWFFRTIVLGVMLFRLQSALAQTPGIIVSNGTAGLSWPETDYYYLLQSSTNLTASNAWFNVATASALASNYSFSIPPQTGLAVTAPVITNIVGGNFVVTQSVTGAGQFFRLQAPQKPLGIPVCSFGIFYDGELELSDLSTLTIGGPVHANGPIDLGTISGSTLTFNSTITTTSVIGSPERAGLTFPSWTTSTVFKGQPPYVTNVPAFFQSLGTTNPHAIIQAPPAGEDPNSLVGQSRLFNQAQVVLIISNSVYSVTATNPTVYLALQNSYNGLIPGDDPARVSYLITNATTALLQTNLNNSTNIALPFLTLTNDFCDQRENQYHMFVTQINVGAFADWAATNPCVLGKLNPEAGLYPTILYVADRRLIMAANSNRLAVVRLVNAQKLPANNGQGFNVATQNPLCVLGNYNTTRDGVHFALAVGSTTNGYTVPAALIADAITVLSSNWNDKASSATYTARIPVNTTLNAVIIAGDVPSTGTTATTFSGGVQNLTRLLENWSGYTLNYNTSLVCLYGSQMATNQFQLPGYYYTAPTRNWGFDPNFSNPYKLPQGIPTYTLP